MTFDTIRLAEDLLRVQSMERGEQRDILYADIHDRATRILEHPKAEARLKESLRYLLRWAK